MKHCAIALGIITACLSQTSFAEEKEQKQGLQTTQRDGVFIVAGDKVYLGQTNDLNSQRLALLKSYMKKNQGNTLIFSDDD